MHECCVAAGRVHDAQHEQRLTREEERAVAQAMDGDIRPGGCYECGCGYVYAIGECGGPMQQALCPGCGSNIGGFHIGWQVVIRMLALMVLERLCGHSDVLAYWRYVHPMVCVLDKRNQPVVILAQNL